jgi:CTP synthase (UTP-ammonia lyase)
VRRRWKIAIKERAMYANILIPTDGSELSSKAVQHSIALAKRIGAKVTVLTVAQQRNQEASNARRSRSRMTIPTKPVIDTVVSKGCGLIVMASLSINRAGRCSAPPFSCPKCINL